MTRRNGVHFPFPAIVGQESLKTALLMNAVDPRVGGVLIRGQKGTAKSTAVRSLAYVLPSISVVDGCRFSCDPFESEAWCDECRVRSQAGALPTTERKPYVVDLPVSATEDRLVGTVDLEHALRKGERRFEAGLLADANRGILYVDEVNLLDDHLVDTLLDVAAMGVNTVQREGIGVSHPSRFILVGTMNPEEGEVRPQLLDRFGLCVEVEGLADPDMRVDVMRRRSAFDDDPAGFSQAWHDEERSLESLVVTAQSLLSEVTLDDDILLRIASLCAELGVDGHRADLTLARASKALAALEGQTQVSPQHVEAVAPLVLAHRMRRKPFEQMSLDQEIIHRVLSSPAPTASDSDVAPDLPKDGEGSSPATDQLAAYLGIDKDAQQTTPSDVPRVPLGTTFDRAKRTQQGRRIETVTGDKRGRFARTEPRKSKDEPDVALAATIREAAAHQADRTRSGEVAIRVEPEDVQNKVRTRKTGASIVFCVDASGSMGATARMSAAKTAILELLVDAYQRRDRVGMVSFRGNDAEVVLAPTASVELAQMKLKTLATGGSTPLAHGLRAALEVLESERRRDSETVPWLVLVTDGRANVGLDGGLGSEDARTWAARLRSSEVHTVVIDTDSGRAQSTGARDLARLANGEYVRLSEVSGPSISQALRDRLSN